MPRKYKIQQNSMTKQYSIALPKAVVETKGWGKGTALIWREGQDMDTLQLIRVE